MSGPKSLIFGVGGHASSVFDCLTDAQSDSVCGWVEPDGQAAGEKFGIPIISQDEALRKLVHSRAITKGFIAVGDNYQRYLLSEAILEANPEFEFMTVVHSSARVSSQALVERGVFVGALASIGPNCRVSQFAMINTLANVEHDSEVGAFASLGPNSVMAGKSRIGPYSVLGMNATVLQKRQIGEHAIVGAASLLADDVPDFGVYYGSKALPRGERKAGDPYL